MMQLSSALSSVSDEVVAKPAAEYTSDAVSSRVNSAEQHLSRDEAEELFLENLAMIRRLLGQVARQHRLSTDDVEEFTASAQLRIISDDYAILRKFRGRCTLRTFLTVVIQRLCLDYRAAQWGKWRPSAKSRRGGEVAMLLERFIVRDNLTFEEACSVLEINYGLSIERDTLSRLYTGFRSRCRPRFVSDEELGELPATQTSPDKAAVDAEHDEVLAHATGALAAALAEMTPRDRLLLQLRFAEGMQVTDIARILTLDKKWLFRRLNRLLAMLRKRLESEGVHGSEVMPALGRPAESGADLFSADQERCREGLVVMAAVGGESAQV